ncbi:SRPBCC domain-containing protein [Pedobacter sp. JY14-1]|uniref:SRPBCC family protein n=1 Tax=Pedobacter sp. JY14-1 TaxID=3034151 RepID=UPI0023E205B2|nr:SRPBCC domain-containing protein [Pedobacter sp. JY14-1]
MEQKTKIHAEAGKQELVITREFDLPLELLFKAYEDPELIAQWMSTKVLELENRKHGSWRFETSYNNQVVFSATGVYLEFIPNRKITRTFEMENSPFPVQLEFLEFESTSADTSKLTMHIIFKSVAFRDQLLQMPFAQGLNMAHNRLQETAIQIRNNEQA